MSSSSAKTGQEVPFEVTEDVLVQGVPVITKGASAIASVTAAESKKSMGRGGKLNMNIDYVRLIDNEKAQLRATQENKGGGHVGAMTGAMVATAVVFFPAAPLFLFVKGKDITIPKGTEITAFVEGDMRLSSAVFGFPPIPIPAPAVAAVAPAASVAASVAKVTPVLAPAPAAETIATITVDSSTKGADIEVDGHFAGSTPSTLSLAPGQHTIAVKKKGFVVWTRTLNVSGNGLHLSAELETETPPPSPASHRVKAAVRCYPLSACAAGDASASVIAPAK